MDNCVIPQGYKATALGIIPQEWEVMPLSKAFHLQSGYAFKSELFSADQGVPIVRISNLPIDNKYVDLSDCVYYYPASENIKQQFIVHKKDLLIAMSGATTGKTAIYNYSYNAFLNQRVGVFKQTSDKVCYQYLQAIVESQLFTTRLQPLLIAGAQPNISPSDIENMIFPFPPLAEQRKIAEVLGVWDEAIEKQARLIEKLALRKRALMQRLLSAKLRLPGFSEPWEKVKLGDIGHFLSSNTLSRDCLNEQIGNIKNIHYGDILIKLPTIVDASFIHIPYVNDDVIVKSDYLKNGDIIFADTAEDYTVGKAIEIINIQAIPVTSGLHTIPFRPKSGIFVNRFLGYYVNSTDYRRQLQPLIQGIKVYSISKTALCKTTLKIPTLSEQTAIAEVLTAADREIDLAKEKLERLRRQKRGLMQQLLTGKKRIAYF